MANYKSIQDIQDDFGIQTNDIVELKKELKELIKDIHPDKNNGHFKSKLNEINFHRITSALEFLNQDFAIVPKSELTALTTILSQGIPDKKEEAQTKNLEERINKTVVLYRDSNLLPKISSTLIATIMTFIWLFPSTVKDHPILSIYLSPTNLLFTGCWFYSILLTGAYWMFAKRNEEAIKEATNKLNLESVQNTLYEYFIRIKLYRVEKEDLNSLTFSKDELIEHIAEHNIFSLDYNPRSYRVKNPLNILSIIKFKDRNIGLELAQTLADIIIERAKRKRLIKLEEDNNLSDTYRQLALKSKSSRSSEKEE